MHPEYAAARRRFTEIYGRSLHHYEDQWDEALAKDPTGTQCVRMIKDLEEQLRKMKE